MKPLNVEDIRNYFIEELKNERFTTDKTKQRTIEMLGSSFIASEPAIFGTPNEEYIEREIDWYLSGSTNINDIYADDRDPPAAWVYSANRYGSINSNYGKLIFDYKYYSQYDNVLNELTLNKDTRRASMVYQRPSIWTEYNEDDKNDFICTNAVTYYIRDDKLHAVVQMRSNDVVFGYKNDYAWQSYVLAQLLTDLNAHRQAEKDAGYGDIGQEDFTAGDITWQVQNLHVYERHFHLVK